MMPPRRWRTPSTIQVFATLAVIACFVASASTVVAILAITKVTSTANDANDSARISCERSQTFGPQIALAYEKYRILNPEQLAAYKATIPETCP